MRSSAASRDRAVASPWAAGRRRFALGSCLLLAAALVFARPADAHRVGGEPAGARQLKDGETATFDSSQGAVDIIRFDGNYDRGEPFNSGPRQAVAQAYYGVNPDDVDYLIVFSTFDFDLGDARAFYAAIQNTTEGIGSEIFDQSNFYGSGDGEPGRLQGYVDMGRLTSFDLDPRSSGYERLLAVMTHEINHRWCCFVTVDHPVLAPDALIGRGDAHWSNLFSSGASVMYGHEWGDNGDGSYSSQAFRKFYGPLDLYLAGLLRPEQVGEMTFIENPALDPDVLPEEQPEITGTPQLLTVSDVIRSVGPRVPAEADSPRDQRAGFILLARSGEEIDPDLLAAMERIRIDFAERYAAMTGGAARIEVFNPGAPGAAAGEPGGGTGGGTLSGETADIALALDWLRGEQQADGSWVDTTGSQLRDTQEALETLTALDPTWTRIPEAIGWIDGEPRGSGGDANTDFIARAYDVLSSRGVATGARQSLLLNRQNDDGGWGAGAGYRSDPLDTALVLLALENSATPSATAAGLNYVLASERPGGGWSSVEGGAARVSVTSVVLETLLRFGRGSEPAARRGLLFLSSKQNPDGGFGDSPSSLHDTARALETLVAYQAAGMSPEADRVAAEAYVRTRQSTDGSWDGSVYATALAARVLEASGLANLQVAGPSADPAAPRDGERIRLRATVTNAGGALASAVVDIFDGDPASGALIERRDLGALASGEARSIDVPWDTFGLAGPHVIHFQVDSDGLIAESNEFDNAATLAVEVAAPPVGIDLEAGESALEILPSSPDHLPAELSIFMQVRNLGTEDAPSVPVRLWRGEPGTGDVVFETSIAVPSRTSTPVQTTDTLTSAGGATYTLEIDPDGAVTETDEGNNVGRRTVTTTPNLDLTVQSLVADGSFVVGGDVALRAQVANRGTLGLERDVEVVWTLDGPGGPVELGRRSVFFEAGESAEIELLWRASDEGDFTATAALDLAGSPVILDSDAANDSAQTLFSIGANTLPNLKVDIANIVQAPAPALEGQALEISGVVENTGAAAGALTVSLYDGTPQDGVLIAPPLAVAGLAPGASAPFGFTWPRYPDDQDRVLSLEARFDVATPEITDLDNVVIFDVAVLSLPDVAISSASLTLDPAFPAPGDVAELRIAVSNLGEQPTSNVVIRVYDADPQAGGVLLAEGSLASLAAGAETTASIPLSAPGAEGLAVAFVVVDPEGLIEEGSEANNSASLEYGVQDGDVAASPRFISPNGDGVQDVAAVVVRAPAEDVLVQVLDGAGESVVELTAESVDGETRAVWDGRRRDGRLVSDGDYVVVASVGGVDLGQARVGVDTNRAPLLDALGTELADERCLTCGVPRPSSGVIPTADEEWFFFRLTAPDGDFPAGVYRVSADGSQLETLFAATGNDRVLDLDVAPSGEAYYIRVENPLFPSQRFSEIRFLDGEAVRLGDRGFEAFDVFDTTGDHFFGRVGGDLYRFRTEDLRTSVVGEFWATPPPGASLKSVSPTATSALFAVGSSTLTQAWILNLATGDVRELAIPAGERLEDEVVWSWDGSRVLFSLQNVSGGEGQAFALDEFVVFDRSGTLLLRRSIPNDLPPAEIAGRFGDPAWTTNVSYRDATFDAAG
ncbi:MAG: CARDB domain-containing protein, partial [Acidobacteriota bacterium]